MSKKLRAALEKRIDFLIKKTSKIDEKSSPKVRRTLFAKQIDKRSLPGAPFGAKDRFLVDFGQSSQTGDHHWAGTLLAATLGASAHLSRFWFHFGIQKSWKNHNFSKKLRFEGLLRSSIALTLLFEWILKPSEFDFHGF